jgi:hypothetical protein
MKYMRTSVPPVRVYICMCMNLICTGFFLLFLCEHSDQEVMLMFENKEVMASIAPPCLLLF